MSLLLNIWKEQNSTARIIKFSSLNLVFILYPKDERDQERNQILKYRPISPFVNSFQDTNLFKLFRHMHRNSYVALSYKSIEKFSKDLYKVKWYLMFAHHSTSSMESLLHIMYLLSPGDTGIIKSSCILEEESRMYLKI